MIWGIVSPRRDLLDLKRYARSIRKPLPTTISSLISWAGAAIGSVNTPTTAPMTNIPILQAPH
jgi:hypothetical protein